jgi:NADPH-dependent glutamate synthase beta subunit-like oxidoreductase
MAGLTLAGIPQYYLMKSVVKAYLSYLAERGEVTPRLDGNRLWWEGAPS